ncbi:MAG: diacylglycerol kinase family protein [Oscillospiraceae bacterium]
MKIEKELKGLAKSFTFAFRGIKNCVLSERNMRIHLVVTVFLLVFSAFYDFSKIEYILLFLAISSVIACEMMNTAVEAVVDMVSPSYSKHAQVAKDIAAGAVFVSAIFALVVGFFLFYDVKIFVQIFDFFTKNPFLIVALLAAVSIGLIFIFKGVSSTNKNKYKGKI